MPNLDSRAKRAQAFWNWFSQNHQQYLFLSDVDANERERLMDGFLVELHKYNKHLFFEIGGDKSAAQLELAISADGIVKYFPAVEFLVEKAPFLKDWMIMAFKQPMDSRFVLDYQGYEFDPQKIIFIPLTNEKHADHVGLSICYPDYNEEQKSIFVGGTYLLLDALLGEKSSCLDIDYLKVIRTPDNIGDYDFSHLSNVKEYVDEVKGRWF